MGGPDVEAQPQEADAEAHSRISTGVRSGTNAATTGDFNASGCLAINEGMNPSRSPATRGAKLLPYVRPSERSFVRRALRRLRPRRAALGVPQRLHDELSVPAQSLLLDLVANRDRDYLRAPTIHDLHHRGSAQLSELEAALGELLDRGALRATIELSPDVLFGYRYCDPVTRPPRKKRRHWKRRTIPAGSRAYTFERFGRQCQNPLCSAPDGRASVDHFIPWGRVRTNHKDNLCVLCEGCNQRKRSHLPGDFISLELATRRPLPDRAEDLRALRGRIRRYLELGFGGDRA